MGELKGRVNFRPDYLNKKMFDAVVIGGGPVGTHTAHALDQAGIGDILAVTSTRTFGGLADRSLEQTRMFHHAEAPAWMVDRTLQQYEALAVDLGKTRTPLPYIFLVGEQRPDRPSRPTLASYQKIISDMQSWGYDPQAEIVSPETLQERYPFIDGEEITAGVIVHNAGRLHFDTVKDALITRSHNTIFASGVQADQVLFGKDGNVTGVKLGDDTLHTEKVVVAPGAFITNLDELVSGIDVREFISNNAVAQRELFYAPVHGLPANTNVFVISPDMAIVRFETDVLGDGFGTYGFAFSDEPHVTDPDLDPQADINMLRTFPFPIDGETVQGTMPSVVYELLGAGIRRYTDNNSRNTLARNPIGATAGYYPEWGDGLPVIGQLPGTEGVIIAAGSSHFGVMTGTGFGETVVDFTLGSSDVPNVVKSQVAIDRPIEKHNSLVL